MSHFRHFGGMCWPAPGEDLDTCASVLVWHNQQVSQGLQSEMLVATAVINAYNELIRLPAKKRNAIIRELRKGPGKADPQ